MQIKTFFIVRSKKINKNKNLAQICVQLVNNRLFKMHYYYYPEWFKKWELFGDKTSDSTFLVR